MTATKYDILVEKRSGSPVEEIDLHAISKLVGNLNILVNNAASTNKASLLEPGITGHQRALLTLQTGHSTINEIVAPILYRSGYQLYNAVSHEILEQRGTD